MGRKVSTNPLDRASVFARKWVEGFVQGLRPPAILSRFNGPRIFINSVPKAGTHLLETTLAQFPQLRFSGRPTVTGWSDDHRTRVQQALRRIRRGSFRSGHSRYWPELRQTIVERQIKVIQMIRDPRDVIVSQWKYVTQINLVHKEGRALRAAADTDKLLCMIEGIPGAISPLGDVWKAHRGWLSFPEALVVRFEELIGPRGGGTRELQMNALARIARHLGISADTELLELVGRNLFSERSATFRQGRIAAWREELHPEHNAAIKRHLGSLLVELGYEKDQDW